MTITEIQKKIDYHKRQLERYNTLLRAVRRFNSNRTDTELIIEYLQKHGPCSIPDITKNLHIDYANCSVLLNMMCKKQQIRKIQRGIYDANLSTV